MPQVQSRKQIRQIFLFYFFHFILLLLSFILFFFFWPFFLLPSNILIICYSNDFCLVFPQRICLFKQKIISVIGVTNIVVRNRFLFYCYFLNTFEVSTVFSLLPRLLRDEIFFSDLFCIEFWGANLSLFKGKGHFERIESTSSTS